MEKETEENTNFNEGETLLKEIELNFKQIKRNAPNEISEQIQTYYDQFITLTKGSEKDHIFDNLEILNTIVNNMSDAFKELNSFKLISLSSVAELSPESIIYSKKNLMS